jgi:riboflavin kinase/FMN adenylyltransferase
MISINLNIFNDIESIEDIPNPVLTIGTFDGVHLGHQRIIDRLNREAKLIGGESVLFTFCPHPRMVLYPETHGLKLLQTQQEKLCKLEENGLQNIIIHPFSFDFSRLTAVEFVRDYLINKLRVKKLVIGYDHQFGRNREGTIEFLKSIADVYEFEVIEIPAQEIDEVNVSSTKIRGALLNGDVQRASEFLGYSYMLTGLVMEGEQLGRSMGYPTANLSIQDSTKLIPANGVYAVKCYIDDKVFCGMMNIGIRPTVSSQEMLTLEVHLFDFSDTIYGQFVHVHFISRIRNEQRFNSVNELKEQLNKDERMARAMLLDLVR